jgi:hypothetical protein
MARMQKAIEEDTLEDFVFEFVNRRYKKKGKVPDWVMEGMRLAEFDLTKFRFNED